jgi:hypothetical protein
MWEKEGSSSFLKKRTKKLLLVARPYGITRVSGCCPKQSKVFWFFFSKKNDFLLCRMLKKS